MQITKYKVTKKNQISIYRSFNIYKKNIQQQSQIKTIISN